MDTRRFSAIELPHTHLEHQEEPELLLQHCTNMACTLASDVSLAFKATGITWLNTVMKAGLHEGRHADGQQVLYIRVA